MTLPIPPAPGTEDIKAIWRVGLIAYREERRRNIEQMWRAHHVGRDAILAGFPHLSMEEASRHMTHAVAWCARAHRKWLDNVPHREWIWPPDVRGVGIFRNPGYEDA